VHHFNSVEYSGSGWRFVEAQHKNSTMKLVDSEADQATLERLLDETKPPVPSDCAHLHYLLFTPFRYEARKPTRFRRMGQSQGVFYCAESIETAAAEMAFYRLLFFLESPETQLPIEPFEMTAFSVHIFTADAWDISTAENQVYFDRVDYEACHHVADNALATGIDLIRYKSVRHNGGINLAVLNCRAFAETRPSHNEGWKFRLHSDRVTVVKSFGSETFEFLRTEFAADPRISAAK
jgi:hypothetical protein